jgi:hypothetical protein
MEKMKQIRNSFLLIICLSLAARHVAARTFRAALPEIRMAAFYRIALPPHVSAIAGPDLHSLRLYSVQGREQPYLTGIFSAAKAKQRVIPDDKVSVPVAGFSQTDSSDKRSYIRIRFDESYLLDQLRLQFEGPRFYSRILTLPDALPDWQRRIHQNQDLVVATTLRARDLMVIVANDDNPPLKLRSARAIQNARYLTAWLEPGIYRLEYDDTGSIAPRYDIVVLADSLAKLSLLLLQPAATELVNAPSGMTPLRETMPETQTADSPHTKSILIWCIAGVILIALISATRALARRVSSQPDES